MNLPQKSRRCAAREVGNCEHPPTEHANQSHESKPQDRYDPAGNRASDSTNGAYTCNDLNMLTKVGSGGTNNYSNDPLGIRDSDPSGASYGWDQLNRLTSYTKSSTTTSYGYRADGMRVQKSSSSAGTTFAYDGQMGFEDTDSASSPDVTDYAIGPRGIDRLAKTVSGSTTTVYPIFDGHGNMVATLGESGASYTTGLEAEQVLLYMMCGADMGAVDSDANAYAGL